LRALLAGEEPYLFKIDPDTRIWRRLTTLPCFSSVFGTLETVTENHRDAIAPPPNVQGGCIGMTRDAAAAMLASGLIDEELCVTHYAHTWARCSDMRACASRGSCCDDFIISWAAHAVGVPIVGAAEIASRWRRTVSNGDLRYAITHPHKQG
jgi:hypothetical protein